ncbi:MAG: hypothetical protein HY553_08570 [Elusimicrobia bacterium]|nr:hypothetical protein [Elusimicrobiota bacterium]
MTLHTPIRDRLPRGPSNPSLPFLRGLLAALALAALMPQQAAATVEHVAVAPAEPRTCDPVTFTASGAISNPCYGIVGAKITGPEPVPCMRITPCPAIFRIEILVREPNPAIGAPCPAVIEPYIRSFSVGTLPAGGYIVTAVERVIPYAPEASDSTIDSSFVSTAFTVRPDTTCKPGEGCYLYDFVPDVPPPDGSPPPLCTATAAPGGTACLKINLLNFVPVGGLQMTVGVAAFRDSDSIDPPIHAISVEAVGRARDFQVAWSAEGARTRFLLYSPSGALIEAGRGPVVRICFSVPKETAPGTYPVHVVESIVADSTGTAIPLCPTFAPIEGGRICVGSPGCDVNGDGASDILDVIRIVRCALSAGPDTISPTPLWSCPDSVAARADCNGDGSVDIRDVICCVRKILQLPRLSPPLGGEAPAGSRPTQIGFSGSVRWINGVEGLAIVELKHGDDWGGTQFSLDLLGSPVRVRDVRLSEDPAGVQLEWAEDGSGGARVMVYAAAAGLREGLVRVQVSLERTPNGGLGVLRLADARSGTLEGAPAPIETATSTLEIPEAAAEAPALLAARPNPFLGRTDAGFSLPREARVSLRLYDVAGRLVKTLVDGTMPAGVHRVSWDGTDSRGRHVPAAIYFARFEAGVTLRSERWLLLR